jgi:hypothetical protein
MPKKIAILLVRSAAQRQLFEAELKRLELFMGDLRDTCVEFSSASDCSNCSKERVATCRGRLPSFYYDLHDLVAEHLENTEKVIGEAHKPERDAQVLKLRQQELAELMREVNRLVRESEIAGQQERIEVPIRQVYYLISKGFCTHFSAFDKRVLQKYSLEKVLAAPLRPVREDAFQGRSGLLQAL